MAHLHYIHPIYLREYTQRQNETHKHIMSLLSSILLIRKTMIYSIYIQTSYKRLDKVILKDSTEALIIAAQGQALSQNPSRQGVHETP